ncbi:uncharacterized protein LOC120414474 [Culex pipiens pallens]|uniref:uncharacterized protein LOC120414474 n=1 Tax=Culex pipiens pallens TaxID=42434 RepID=UPI0019532692|nr:uncharacterized protein LOC120414474 [Culex pipiens pallens]
MFTTLKLLMLLLFLAAVLGYPQALPGEDDQPQHPHHHPSEKKDREELDSTDNTPPEVELVDTSQQPGKEPIVPRIFNTPPELEANLQPKFGPILPEDVKLPPREELVRSQRQIYSYYYPYYYYYPRYRWNPYYSYYYWWL